MANDGSLLGAHIAKDDQWRFPQPEELPQKYKTALLCYEDEHYYRHPGINPFAIARALRQNIKAGKTISGGSTITMQVARMARNAPRTVPNKLWEMIKALRLELTTSKKNILLMYAANAPFGGNIVGFEAASWHYFKCSPRHITWAEAALLAVLPNAPGIMRPDRGADQLRKKRNRLLKKLHNEGYINHTELGLSLKEALPKGPRKLPFRAPHLVSSFTQKRSGQTVSTNIDPQVQQLANYAVKHHAEELEKDNIHHAGVIIAEIETGEVIAYIGNTAAHRNAEGHAVDMIRAERSSGSILKPFLYAAALQDGTILPDMLLADIPTRYRSYAPKNFNRKFHGAVPAGEALTRSLNVPFVRLLDDYGGERFLKKLNKAGITTLDKGFNHYGLSLILGGGETTLWELTGSYASMARTLKHFTESNNRYLPSDFKALQLINHKKRDQQKPEGTKLQQTPYPPVLSAGAIWHTFEAMKSLVRPPEETGWKNFTSQQNIAWKTGTSFGFRDAWSIGVNGRYVVGVWAGNASGEGRPGLVGGTAAAPLMFRIFDFLPSTGWFDTPHDDLAEIIVCPKSGHRANPDCPNPKTVLAPKSVKSNPACPYHQLVHLTPDRRYRTNRNCQPYHKIVTESRFVLPPRMAWYYNQNHGNYQHLPPLKPGCIDEEKNPMDFIYPRSGSSLALPVDLDGEKQSIVLQAAHANPEATIYWHLNDTYMGTTSGNHNIEISPIPGQHKLTIVDKQGHSVSRSFTILND